MDEPDCNRAFYLPRLPREFYQGDAVVHWSLPISQRQRGWLDDLFQAAFRERLFHTAARESFFRPSDVTSIAGRFLARILEALRRREIAGCGEHQASADSIVAAIDARRLKLFGRLFREVGLEPPYAGCYEAVTTT